MKRVEGVVKRGKGGKGGKRRERPAVKSGNWRKGRKRRKVRERGKFQTEAVVTGNRHVPTECCLPSINTWLLSWPHRQQSSIS